MGTPRSGLGLVLIFSTLLPGCDDADCFHFAKDVPYEVWLERYVGPPQGSDACGEGIDLSEGTVFRFRVLEETRLADDADCSIAVSVRIEETMLGSMTLEGAPAKEVGRPPIEASYLLLGTLYQGQLTESATPVIWSLGIWSVHEPNSDVVFAPYNPDQPELYLVRSLDPQDCADEWEVSLSRVEQDAGPPL